MKLQDLFETGQYGVDDIENNDDASAANETGAVSGHESKKNLSMAGRGTNYKKASRIVGRAKLAKRDPNVVRDDTPEQHGQNFSTMNFRR